MAQFRFEAIDGSGRMRTGYHSADVAAQVEEWLTAQGLIPVSIEADGRETARDAEPGLLDRIRGVRTDDLILFTRQIATMIAAGVPILKSLDIMGRQTGNPALRAAVEDIALAIEGGASLHEAMAAYPAIFSQLFINVITIGEESGNLDNAFIYLAELLENEKAVQEKIKSATRYPKIVVSAIFIAVFILMSFVVPKFAQLYAASKVPLPLPTRMLLAVSGFFASHYKAILAAVLIAIFGFRELRKRPAIRMVLDRLVLRVPVFGELALKIYMSRFCRVFALLTKSGIDIIKTLTLSSAALDNMVLMEKLRQITDEVREGSDLFTAFSRHSIFPEMVSQMLAIGEESGQIDTMMAKVADYYDMDTDYTIRNLATLIEPFLLLFLGIMVAFIALSIFLPIWNLMSVMRGG